MRSHRSSSITACLIVLALPSAAQQPQAVREVEPNDGLQTATLAKLGDTISGTINPYDVDYFAVDLEAGTQLQLIAAPVPFCRDFSLLDPSGNRLAFGDCIEGIDSLRYTIPATGRFGIRITQFDDAPGDHPLRPYSLRLGTNSATIDVSTIVNALLAAQGAVPDSSLVRMLDRQGNGNGVLDVGDLRAYLRAEGLLPAPRPKQ
jgi:hypothetical protein